MLENYTCFMFDFHYHTHLFLHPKCVWHLSSPTSNGYCLYAGVKLDLRWSVKYLESLGGVCAMVSPDPGISDVYVRDNKREKL